MYRPSAQGESFEWEPDIFFPSDIFPAHFNFISKLKNTMLTTILWEGHYIAIPGVKRAKKCVNPLTKYEWIDDVQMHPIFKLLHPISILYLTSMGNWAWQYTGPNF